MKQKYPRSTIYVYLQYKLSNKIPKKIH